MRATTTDLEGVGGAAIAVRFQIGCVAAFAQLLVKKPHAVFYALSLP
jgi:hypothetical protein